MNQPNNHTFFNPRAQTLANSRLKDLRDECKHSYLNEIIEARKFLEADPKKNKSKIEVMTRAIQRHNFLH